MTYNDTREIVLFCDTHESMHSHHLYDVITQASSTLLEQHEHITKYLQEAICTNTNRNNPISCKQQQQQQQPLRATGWRSEPTTD